ncbi:MAG: Glyoxalase/bleomycin resistance protein/dioxygenase [Cyanobacteria bacterium RYN_339]|nr:Glyoxalase/bleomycin resistance protein/dioxygenase [Cyanobacteria bacterium RYN_339]
MSWLEIYADDAERARRFYSDVFGWQFRALRSFHADYWFTDGRRQAGAVFPRPAGARPGAIMHVEVKDLPAALARAAALGAARELETDAYVVVRDPDGNALGLWAR